MKQQLVAAFEDPKSKRFAVVNDGLALITIISIASLVLETVPSYARYQPYFYFVEWFTVGIFALEYVARIIVSRPTTKYIFSFYGLVDLISILPSFIGFGNFTFLKAARSIRLIRLLRLLRLAKLARVPKSRRAESNNFLTLNLLLVTTTLITALLLVGTLIYLAEGDNSAFASIPLGMLWSFKVFLVGIPIEQPVTDLGMAVHIFGRLLGLIILGVVIGVTGNLIQNYIFAKQK